MHTDMKENANLIKDFFTTIQLLKSHKVIRSDRYLGDIGEYIAETIYMVKLSSNLREEVIDGHIGNEKVQVKFNCSTTKTNLKIGNANHYDRLILILHQSSLHFPDNCTADFVGYSLDQLQIQQAQLKPLKDGSYSFTKRTLSQFEHREINFNQLV